MNDPIGSNFPPDTVYLNENPSYPAIRVSEEIDACGQSPYRFLAGPWEGKIVHVEPYKMEPLARE